MGAHHQLDSIRALFMQGRSPYQLLPAFRMTLFLSADEADVQEAVRLRLPAGRVLATTTEDDDGADIRIAFDFDGVLADDWSVQIMQADGLDAFHQNETDHLGDAIASGPLLNLLTGINRIQRRGRRDENVRSGLPRACAGRSCRCQECTVA